MVVSVAFVAIFCRFKLNFLPLKKYALKQDILIPVLHATREAIQPAIEAVRQGHNVTVFVQSNDSQWQGKKSTRWRPTPWLATEIYLIIYLFCLFVCLSYLKCFIAISIELCTLIIFSILSITHTHRDDLDP
jgi:hypothetical protein